MITLRAIVFHLAAAALLAGVILAPVLLGDDLPAGIVRPARDDICNAQLPNRPNFVDSITICRN